jgi:DNA-binding PadR family transcriptional regulator
VSRRRREGPAPDDFLPLPRDTFGVLVSLADRDRHGYAILQDIAERTGGRIRLSPSTLYAVIRRLLESELIEELSERPDPAHADERRRYYRLTPLEADRSGDRLQKLEDELQSVVAALARLAIAIAVGGNIPEIAAEAQKFHQRREALEAELFTLRDRQRVLDAGALRRRLEDRLADWRGPLRRNREQGRQGLQRVLTDRLTFERQPDGSYAFTAPGTLDRIIRGSTEGGRGSEPAAIGWWTGRESNSNRAIFQAGDGA